MKKAILTLLVIIAVVAAAGGVYRHWLNAVPAVVIPSLPMPKPNAFDYFAAATKLIVRRDDIDNVVTPGPVQHYALVNGSVRITSSPHVSFTSAQKEELVRLNAPALAKLRDGFAYPYVYPPVRSFDALMPYYAKYRDLARLLVLAGRGGEAKGDWRDAIKDYLDVVQMGEMIPHGSIVIGRLVGTSCSAIGRKPIWPMVNHLNAAQVRAAAVRLETLRSQEYPLVNTFLQEKWTDQASLLELLRKPGYPDSVLNSYINSMGITMPPGARKLYEVEARTTGKKKLMDDTTTYYSALVKNAQQPQPMLTSEPAVPLDYLYLLEDAAAPWLFKGLGKGVFLKTLDNQAQNALLEVTLALRAYKLEHGIYPDTLSDLVPEYIKSVPVDLFSAGSPVKYMRSGVKYVLYSIGPDGIDDRGTPTVGHYSSGRTDHFTMPDSKGDIVAGVDIY